MWLSPETIANIANFDKTEDIVAGNTVTDAKTLLGKCIALMGFPGGGLLGYDRVWKVDENGYSMSLPGGNLVINKEVYEKMGGFDERFRCCEDTFFAQKLLKNGYKIRYNPKQIAYHIERDSLKSFIKWHIHRGTGAYTFKKHYGSINKFFWLRLWAFKNSILKSGLYSPFVIGLFILAALCQYIGFQKAVKKPV